MKKRICFIKPDITPSGGGERVAINLANELCKTYDVHVVSICSSNGKPFYPINDEITYMALMEGTFRIRKMLLKGIRELRRYLRNNRIDIVFSVGVSANPFLIPATAGLKCKAIVCEHLNCLNSFQNDFGQRFCRYLGAKWGDKVIVLTKQDRDAYKEKYHLKRQKVSYIHNWIEEVLFDGMTDYNSSAKKIITVARIEPVKGIENIIEVSKELSAEFPDWSWDIYGGGDESYVADLTARIKENNLEGFVNLKGKVGDIYDRYKNYSMCVLTSYCEGLPMVLLEAKAKRLPCISYDCLTGPREIIRDGVDGYLIPVDDIQCLKKRLSQCMRDEELRKNLSANSYGNMDLFRKETIIKRWIEFIDKM